MSTGRIVLLLEVVKQVGGGVGGFRWWVWRGVVVEGEVGRQSSGSSHQLIPKGSCRWRPEKCFYGEATCKKEGKSKQTITRIWNKS